MIYTSSYIIFGLAGCMVIVSYFVSYLLYIQRTTYKITKDKIILNKKVFGEKHEEIPLDKIQNTIQKKSYTQKLFGDYGNISVSTAGSDAQDMSLSGIQNPDMIYSIILRNSKLNNNVQDNEKGVDNSMLKEAKKLRETSNKFKNIIQTGDKL